MKQAKYFTILLITLFLSCKKDSSIPSRSKIPRIYIEVDNNEEITSKESYYGANLLIRGTEKYEDYEGRMQIRGRGNSSWEFPKKPYRLKLETRSSLFGLASYKNWILLSEYLDGSMLYNSIPFEAGRMLGIPYTNHVIPVEVTINGEYKGFYVFMEHKEVGPDRIDIGEDGILLELDSHFDEDWQFKSSKFNLPVMVQHPESEDMTPGKLEEIKNDFEELEALLHDPSFPNNNYLDYFDDLSFVNYMIVYQLTLNAEINHPKSTYINKMAGGKYRMGIIWDFDWGFGYPLAEKHYDISAVATPLFIDDPMPGTTFFSKFMQDTHLQHLFKERWEWFKANNYQELRQHVKNYAELVRPVYGKDHAVWGARNSSGNLNIDLQNALNWLDARVNYIDSYVSEF